MRRRWIFWILVVAFVWLVVARFAEIKKLAEILALGRWEWVLAAAALQVVYYLVYTGLYQSAFDAVEVESRLLDLLPVTFVSIFVNVAAPAGGAGGAALFVDDASRRGQSAARAAAGTLLVLVTDFSAFTLVLIVGLVYLFLYHDLKAYEIVGAVILLLIIAGLTSVLLLGLWQPERLRRLLAWVQKVVNGLAARLHRPASLPDGWVEKNAAEFASAASAIAAHPRRLGRTIVVALAAYLVDVASLYTLFVAFGQPVSLGVLVAGFAMGILFWIVAITPQGIGVVEGVMALVYTSLGVPAEKATVIALAFRGLAFWLPLVIGFVLLRQLKTFGAERRAGTEQWSVQVVAILTGLMGVINVISAATPSLASRLALLERFLPLEVRRGGHLTAALAGFALLLLARSLWRRKRMAWLLTLVVLVISIASHLLKGLDYEEAIPAMGLAVWLGSLRYHFYARSDAPSAWQGLRALLAVLFFILAYGTTGFYLLDRHFSTNFSFGTALEQTVVMFTQFYSPGLEPVTGFGRYFADSIYVVGAVTLGYALLMLLRPVLIRQPVAVIERARVQPIVEAYGHSSLARFTLFDDKSCYFSPGGSVVAYVAKGRAAVSLGDPIGPLEDISSAIAGFREYCAGNDWQAAFYQVLPDHLEHYRAAGFDVLHIGDEAIVDLATFSLEGKAGKHLRWTFKHLTEAGFRTEVQQPPLSDDLLHELRAVSDEWLALVKGTEKRFSLGWFADDYIRNGPVMVVRAPEGWISAFVNIVPEYQLNERSIDLMRHRREMESGTMEFLFVSLFQWAKEQGYATFNLGLSSLTGVGERADDPAIERALHYIYEHINQFYSFQGLHAFKEKFHPQWSPRYLVYPGPASLPAVAVALIRADSGDDFVRSYMRDLLQERRKRDEHDAGER